MHIYLMGYRGSGKSTVGKLLAQAIDRSFVDIDDWIEQNQGQSIRHIFDQQGEAGFRTIEHDAICQVSSLPEPLVVALGGGSILRTDNRLVIGSSGYVVWLDASAEHLFQRISGDCSSPERRPQLTDRGGYTEVAELLAARRPIYEEMSQVTVNVESKSTDEITCEIVDWLKDRGYLPSCDHEKL